MAHYRVKIKKVNMKKLLIILSVVSLIVVIVLVNLQSKREKAVKVSVENVMADDLAAIISASGEVKPKKSVNISAQIPGRVIKIAVEEGQFVQEGDFLLKLEATQYEANAERDQAYIHSLKAELIKAEAYLKRDENNLRRQKNLWDKQLISQEELDAATAQYDISKASQEATTYQIRQAQASLKSTLDNIEKTVYVAPIAGIIASLQVEEGETALVGPGGRFPRPHHRRHGHGDREFGAGEDHGFGRIQGLQSRNHARGSSGQSETGLVRLRGHHNGREEGCLGRAHLRPHQ
jgi:multidrug efflux pump subunit AcrA (membrane-fusion protein)